MFQHEINAFLNFGVYVLISFMALYIFIKLFVMWTPYDDIQKIRDNDLPHAITLSGSCIGFTIPLLICSYLGSSLLTFIELALIIGIVQLILEKLISYWLVHKNEATSIFHASISICAGAIVGFSIIP